MMLNLTQPTEYHDLKAETCELTINYKELPIKCLWKELNI